MRKKIVAGNWKMNMTPAKAVELINSLKNEINTTDVDVVVCPPFVCLPAVLDAVKGTNIAVGAQNMHFEENGAYTGEIAPSMLVELGVKYVIIGHSERRQYFAETDVTVNKKVLKAIEHNLVPILCVGESLEEREQGITIDLVRLQTKVALKDVKAEDAKKVVIAYEPIWAIGTGKTATSAQAEEVCKAIREVVAEVYGQEVADEVRVQYGGSVNAGNANELFNMGNIDGGLVGGASLKAEFTSIVNY
ncbi:triose-phosphate isomerase [Cellulosilyticum sp. ST5]|uniref:Triosephosphate isomerase n=1 Tax=Cellulosilyticum lentocellum (strain ATCC 49066 / DSM 5427 / NCIMB 11756 / RHM5) TaxID=642492 RepID=F2JKZ1_CELLD|nr:MULTISPECIES: triose-phosphate isomerase [Cellulosilyticum]ADZ84532.1 triosephosphate isomerase [Cellulosilyticum lentocellum DSM 5427]QEH69984.1 triose-phosphate isomerase [Cellulosilyticum sp. WCF-2]